MTLPEEDAGTPRADEESTPREEADGTAEQHAAQGPFLVESPRRTSNHVFARGRELLSLLLLVLVADLLIYRGEGYTGFAVFLVCALPLLFFARPKTDASARIVIGTVMAMLVMATAVRTIWLGHMGLVVLGLILLAGWARAGCGRIPFVVDTVLQTMIAPLSGVCVAHVYRYLLSRPPAEASDGVGEAEPKRRPRGLLLPAAAVFTFGTFFVLANPVLQEWLRNTLSEISTQFVDLVVVVMPDFAELFFWAVTLTTAIGLVRPLLQTSLIDSFTPVADKSGEAPSPADHVYASFRNTLIAVTLLFAAYLVFEFITLWRRDFPKGFYYAGYAHAGAAWLTVALATASALLSGMFRGSMLFDARLPTLKRLAWLWSAENFLLAIAVVNRLLIYVDFNGMTRMRVIGFLGIAAVAGGFVLVVIKIARTKSFAWLIHGDFFVVAAAVTVFMVLPVDRLVHAHNVSQVLAGHLAPSVQITEHPRDIGGDLSLFPLLDCDDEIIREGVAAILFRKAEQLKKSRPGSVASGNGVARRLQRDMLSWTDYQHAESQFLQEMARIEGDDRYTAIRDSEDEQKQSIETFQKYAYQWY